MAKYKLGDICEIVSGSTPKTSIDEYWDGDVKWITPAELNDDSYIISDSARKITELAVKKTGLTSFPEGTVILSSRAPIGKVAIAGCEMYCNQGFKNLICSDKIINKYLYWFLKRNTHFLNSLGRGATFKEISKAIVSEIEINVPEIEQQKKVVEILEKVSGIIARRKKELSALDDLIKARFVEMFGDCKKLVSLSDLCLIITDGTHQPPKFQDRGIPFILVSNLSKNTVTYNTEKYINEETYNELYKRTPIETGDVLLSTVGSYGHPAVVVEDKKFLFQRHIAYLKPKRDIINSFYLHSALLSPNGQHQIEEKVKGIAQKTLNLSEIKKIMIPLPSLDEQNEFEAFVKQIDKSKVEVQKALDETQKLFDSLMQQYFG
ncbi:restriction endonuclease subunit S [Blautia obeum]|uniref:restriction endonuclease subunit S n=1 Tax=Blautia obeum TaxID=40520 RepID=UPI00356A323B